MEEERGYIVKKEFTEDHHAVLTVEFDDKEVNRRLVEMARDLRKKVRIPGYRPGKASPTAIIRHIGRDAMLEEMAEEMAEDLFSTLVEEEGLQVIGKVKMETKLRPFSMVFHAPLKPEGKLKEGYEQVRVEMEHTEVGEENIQEVLEEMQQANAQWVPHEEAVVPGDQIMVDLRVTANGETVLEQEDMEFVLEPGGVFLPEFVDQVVGMKPGETRIFTIPYPEDAKVPWAGEDATFEVTIHGAKRQEIPEIDDEFARMVGQYDDLESLKAEIREKMEKEIREKEASEAESRAVGALLDYAEISYPEEAVEEYLDWMVTGEKARIEESGWRWDTYLRVIGKSHEEYRESLRPLAEKLLREKLLLLALAEAEGLVVSDEEVEERIEELAESSDNPEETRKIYTTVKRSRDLLREEILMEKALDVLREKFIVRADWPSEEKEAPEIEGTESEAEEEKASETEESELEAEKAPETEEDQVPAE